VAQRAHAASARADVRGGALDSGTGIAIVLGAIRTRVAGGASAVRLGLDDRAIGSVVLLSDAVAVLLAGLVSERAGVVAARELAVAVVGKDSRADATSVPGIVLDALLVTAAAAARVLIRLADKVWACGVNHFLADWHKARRAAAVAVLAVCVSLAAEINAVLSAQVVFSADKLVQRVKVGIGAGHKAVAATALTRTGHNIAIGIRGGNTDTAKQLSIALVTAESAAVRASEARSALAARLAVDVDQLRVGRADGIGNTDTLGVSSAAALLALLATAAANFGKGLAINQRAASQGSAGGCAANRVERAKGIDQHQTLIADALVASIRQR
jgi:hypothetical protein